mgnify:CR=1 FL=1
MSPQEVVVRAMRVKMYRADKWWVFVIGPGRDEKCVLVEL